MSVPPLLVRISWRRGALGGLWLPIGLLWPFVFLLLVPILLAGLPVCWAAGWPTPHWRSVAAGYRVLCETRGTRIDIDSPGSRVTIGIY